VRRVVAFGEKHQILIQYGHKKEVFDFTFCAKSHYMLCLGKKMPTICGKLTKLLTRCSKAAGNDRKTGDKEFRTSSF
jgi:hypothetical protein